MLGAVLFCALLAGRPTSAQVDAGALQGTVRDQSAAVIPGAKITVTNEGTAFKLSTVSGGDGSYIITPIKIGTYTVEAESQGFQKARRAGIVVDIQQQVVVDFTLVPGAITQTVEVTAESPILQTQNGSVGGVVNSNEIVNLPLNGRNYNFLARLTAGVTHAQEDGRGLDASGWFAANGTRPAQNNMLLDGIDNNSNNVDFLSGAAYVVRPPVDAIAEFKLQTNSFNAEFGRAGGAVLNASLKSGANQIHGSAWEFVRNDKFDAADFFQNANGQLKGKFRRNQFGAAAGGPFKRNRSFWFADYEGTRIRQATPWVANVPTAAERASGYTDFRDLISGQTGNAGTDLLGRTFLLGTIFDPATTRPVVAGQPDPVTGTVGPASCPLDKDGKPTCFTRDPFYNGVLGNQTDFTSASQVALLNQLPAGRLDQNAINLLNLYPDPTRSGLFNNFAASPVSKDNVNQFDVRIDHNFSERNQVFARYSYFDEPRLKPGPFTGFADGGGFNQGDEHIRNQGAALSYTHSFSPTLINEARVGFNREHVTRLQPFGNDTSDIPGKFGIPGILQTKGNGGLPPIIVGGLNPQLGGSEWLVSERFSSTYQITENLTKVYNTHTFKGGLEIQRISFPWIAPPWSRGHFEFDGVYSSIPNQNDGSTGRAQILLSPTTSSVPGGIDNVGGANTIFASNFGALASNKNYYGAYFQDDWKVSPKLTLNLGLRWDHFGLVGDKYGAQANFVPGTPFNGAQFIMPTRRKSDQLSTSFTNTLALDGINLLYSDAYGTGLGITQKLNFAPRFGFAYQPRPKLVVRGGYGIYYGAFENRGGYPSLGYNYPFQFGFGFFAPNSASPITYQDGQLATLERGLLDIPLSPASVNASGLSFRGIEFRYKTPYVQGFNFMTQYEITPNDSFEIGYVASLGRHIEVFTGTNHVTKLLPPDVNPQGSVPYVPFPDFGRDASYASTNANSYYHSLQSKYTRRLSKGLDVLAAYTWAKTRTDAGDLLSGGGVGVGRAPNIPGFGIDKDYGLAEFDVRNAFTLSGTYQLPAGRGKRYMAGAGRVQDAILGGWVTNWIWTMYDGQPVTFNCQTTTAAAVGCFALLVPGQNVIGGKHNVDQWLNPAAFQDPPAATTIGQTDFAPLGGANTQAVGPGFHRFDFSFFKEIKTSEKTHMEFRAEFFNLTNHPNFSLFFISNNFRDTANFAKIGSTRDNPNDPRQVQFALKFYF
jgi:hypothetical protein